MHTYMHTYIHTHKYNIYIYIYHFQLLLFPKGFIQLELFFFFPSTPPPTSGLSASATRFSAVRDDIRNCFS